MRIWSYRYAGDLLKSYCKNIPLITYGSDYCHDYVLAYGWMMAQMEERFRKPSYVELPLWGWYVYNGKNKRPDMRRMKQRLATEPLALIECDLPEDRVLLSDEQKWYFVLSNGYISHSEEEEMWFNEQEKILTPACVQELKVESWNKIFDLAGGDPELWGGPNEKYIQATTWFVNYDEIVNFRLFY